MVQPWRITKTRLLCLEEYLPKKVNSSHNLENADSEIDLIRLLANFPLFLGPRHSLVSTFYDDIFAYDFEKKRWFQLSLKSSKIKSDANSAGNSLKGTVDMDNIASNKLQGGADDDEDVNFDDSEVFINEAAEIMKTIDVNESTITNSKMSTVDANEVVLQAAGGSQTVSETIESNEKSIDQDRSKESVVAKYFNSLISPCPRINPAMILK